MKLTRGEFCQFNQATRFKLLQEFGRNILAKRIKMRLVSIYMISDFYVEVYQNLSNQQLERVEPVKNLRIIEAYNNM